MPKGARDLPLVSYGPLMFLLMALMALAIVSVRRRDVAQPALFALALLLVSLTLAGAGGGGGGATVTHTSGTPTCWLKAKSSTSRSWRDRKKTSN
jgi:hypothetical protein